MNTIETLTAAAKQHVAGQRESVLSSDTRETLDAFVNYLEQVEHKTTATARSYRSYVVTALTNNLPFEQQSSDVRSALRALARFSS